MSRPESAERIPGVSDARRASDELLLRLVREGRHDAEIAVRLGITTGELRERKAELRNRLGTGRYTTLTGGAGTTGGASRRRRALWAGAAGFTVFGALLGAAILLTGEDDAPPAGIPEQVAPAPTSPALAAPPVVLVDGRPFADLGRVILPASGGKGGLGEIDHRAAMVVVPLQETVYLTGSSAVHWSLVSSSLNDAYLRAEVTGRQLDVAIHAVGDARLRPVAAGAGPVLEAEDIGGHPGAGLLVRVAQGSSPVEAQITADGRLLVAEEPLPPETVLDSFTGAALDVSQARPFGTIPRNAATIVQNGCEPKRPDSEGATRCRIAWLRSNRGFTAPVDGTYSCRGGRSLEFRGDGVLLVFSLRGGEASTQFACPASEVRAGDSIVPAGEWIVAALDSGGGPQSIVVALNGQVYVGEVGGNAPCPCLPP